MGKPKVSVILDNYNYEAFIEEAIKSVLNQTYQDFELIIVDDGSTDSSRQIIREYASKSKKIVPILKQNGGQMSAFNAAFQQAKGDIIALLDSDDYWYPKKLEAIVKKHKKYQFVQHYLSNNGKGTYRRINTIVNWHEILIKFGYLYNHSVSSSLSFSRDLLEPFFPLIDEEEMRYCADGILVMVALSLTEVGIIEEELGFYRIHGGNGFVGKSDYGDAARDILHKQHIYANKQLNYRGFLEIPFDNYKYFDYLIENMLKAEKLKKDARIAIYGTESSGLYLSHVLQQYQFDIFGYIDSSIFKQGKCFRGGTKRIYAPQEAYELRGEYDVILIASSASEEISHTLNNLSFKEGLDYYRLPI